MAATIDPAVTNPGDGLLLTMDRGMHAITFAKLFHG
jgi:hypothetical protein